jgi:hypothetical protein
MGRIPTVKFELHSAAGVFLARRGAEKFFATGPFSSFLFPLAALICLSLNNEKEPIMGRGKGLNFTVKL